MKCFYNVLFKCLSIIFIFFINQSFAQSIIISPQPVFAGKIPVSSSSTREISVSNTTAQTINITSISVTGEDAGNYSILNNPGTYSLGPLENLVLNLEYMPSAGLKDEAILEIQSSAGAFSDSLIGFGSPIKNGVRTFERIIGTAQDDGAGSVIQTSDKGYIIVGSTTKPNENYPDIYVIKTDQNGKVIWTKTFGGNFAESGADAAETSDGGYLILGSTESFGNGGSDIYLIKIDAQGNKQWDKTYGGSQDDNASKIKAAGGSSFIISGSTKNTSDNSKNALLLKINDNGNELWSKNYGGNGGETANDVLATSDNGYILVGSTADNTTADFDVYIVKTDASGVLQWSKTYGGSQFDEGSSIYPTNDGGYILGGYTASSGAGAKDAYLLKIDSSGNKLWDKTFGGEHSDSFSSVIEDADGNLLAVGSTVTFFSQNFIYTDLFLVKTNSSGTLIFSKKFGGDKSDNGSSIILADDGAFAISGSTSSYSKNSDVYFLKVNDEGIVTSIKDKTINNQIPSEFQLFQNYPNPFNPTTRINYTIAASPKGEAPGNSTRFLHVTLKVYGILGNEITTLVNKEQLPGRYEVEFDAGSLPSGVYFYELNAGQYYETKKMILLR